MRLCASVCPLNGETQILCQCSFWCYLNRETIKRKQFCVQTVHCASHLSPVMLTQTVEPGNKIISKGQAFTTTNPPVFIDLRTTDLFMHFWIFINLQTAKESINKKTCGIAFHRLPVRHDMSGLQCVSSLRPVRIHAVTLVVKCRHAIFS